MRRRKDEVYTLLRLSGYTITHVTTKLDNDAVKSFMGRFLLNSAMEEKIKPLDEVRNFWYANNRIV